MWQLLDIGVMTAHLLCVNLASAGPLVGAWLDWRAARGDGIAVRAAWQLARWSLVALIAGAVLGLTLGWVRWDAAYRELWLGPLSYKLRWAVVEVVFSAVLLIGWWLWLPREAGQKLWKAIVRGGLAVLASTNLLYHFPFLFTVAAHLHDRGFEHGASVGGREFRQLMVVAETPALAVHVALASLAVAGVTLIWMALGREAVGTRDVRDRLAKWGAWWALAPSLAQLPVGLWTLATLPADGQSRIMGESSLGILVFIAAVGASLWLLSDLAHVAFGETTRSRLWRVIAALLITVFFMIAMQHEARGPHWQNDARGAAAPPPKER